MCGPIEINEEPNHEVHRIPHPQRVRNPVTSDVGARQMNIQKKTWVAFILSLLTVVVISVITIPLKDTVLKEVYRFFHVVGPRQYWVTMIIAFVVYRTIQIRTGALFNRRTVPSLFVLIAAALAIAIWGHLGFKHIVHQVAYPRIERELRNDREAQLARQYLAIQSYYPIILLIVLATPACFLLWTTARKIEKTQLKLQPRS